MNFSSYLATVAEWPAVAGRFDLKVRGKKISDRNNTYTGHLSYGFQTARHWHQLFWSNGIEISKSSCHRDALLSERQTGFTFLSSCETARSRRYRVEVPAYRRSISPFLSLSHRKEIQRQREGDRAPSRRIPIGLLMPLRPQ